MAPARVPPGIIARINRATVESLQLPDIRQRYEYQGLEPTPSSPEQYSAQLRAETDKWQDAVRIAKVQLD